MFLADNANDLVSLAQILGHESLNTTAEYTKCWAHTIEKYWFPTLVGGDFLDGREYRGRDSRVSFVRLDETAGAMSPAPLA